MACDRLSCVRTFTVLFDTFATSEHGVDPQDTENFALMVELWFLYSIIWGIGGPLDESGRKKQVDQTIES